MVNLLPIILFHEQCIFAHMTPCSSEKLNIRPARHDDIEAMVVLLKSLFLLEKDFNFDGHRQAAGLAQLVDSDQCIILVAEKNGQVVGMCSGQPVISTAEGGAALLVEDVVVAQGHQRKGVGSRLLQSLKQWAENQCISRLQLLADRTNNEALNFYAKQHWQTTQLICLRTYI